MNLRGAWDRGFFRHDEIEGFSHEELGLFEFSLRRGGSAYELRDWVGEVPSAEITCS